VMHERCYSFTGRPGAHTFSITVKCQPGGRVSNYLHDEFRVGDIIELGEVGGEFVLPESLPDKMLFIAGGSGIPPVYSLIRTARRTTASAKLSSADPAA